MEPFHLWNQWNAEEGEGEKKIACNEYTEYNLHKSYTVFDWITINICNWTMQ
jgi:hypothetical protein